MATMQALQQKIMRRVYYSYILRLVTHPFTVHALVLTASVFALSRLTHVAAILENMSSVQVGQLYMYIFNALVNAEFLTLVCIGVIMFTLLSLPLRLWAPKFRRMRTV